MCSSLRAMTDLELLVDLHRRNPRQGPGSDAHTRLALQLAGLGAERRLRVADLGCGTGASTKVLADALDATITAVDACAEFLTDLVAEASAHWSCIEPLHASFDDLALPEASFDLLWSEGAIYNLGFAQGLRQWRPLLKANGLIAITEITWLSPNRPKELQEYWENAYSEMGTAGEKMVVLEENGFVPLGYFPLPNECWTAQYYAPLQRSFAPFLATHGHSDAAQACVDAHKAEIAVYEEHGEHFSYGFYVARKA